MKNVLYGKHLFSSLELKRISGLFVFSPVNMKSLLVCICFMFLTTTHQDSFEESDETSHDAHEISVEEYVEEDYDYEEEEYYDDDYYDNFSLENKN